MKKILTILGSLGLISTTGSLVVACKAPKEIKNNLRKLNNTLPKKEKEKSEITELSDNKEENKQENNDELSSELKKEKQEELMQGDEPKEEERYNPKRNKEENFDLIKKDGKTLVDKLFSDTDKFQKLKENDDYKNLSSIITEFTSIYSEISNYSSSNEFLQETNKYPNAESLNTKFDKTYTNYENNKDKIWDLLNKFFKN
ncbi:lipoprotein [Mycoplasma feriruminatoris]|uniref:Lipoprotein n=1 Tax=Mycoplasma feriruminatoris TaxID=1179777 RepID=A0A654INV6_9MOLU|nr:hypothetical protein MF5583_00599 [Mycoplasma feriruminatoris]